MPLKDDLLNKLGSKDQSAEGTGEPVPSHADDKSKASAENPTNNNETKANSENAHGSAESDSAATGQTKRAEGVEEQKAQDSKDSAKKTVQDPDSWTKDSAFAEIKKLREEQKATRIKYNESVEKLNAEAQSRIEAKEKEVEELRQAKKELDRIKTQEEDRKRSLDEKLQNREERIAKLEAMMESQKAEVEKEKSELKSKLEQYESERKAEMEVHQKRLESELEKIPEKFKEQASILVKGAGDPRDALVALNEARLKGMFDEKKVVVNHSVPNAGEGARSNKERLESGAQEHRKSMSSNQKIKEALKQIRDGQSNDAFRTR